MTVYEAWDGEVFDSEAKCVAHERANVWRRLVGLTAEQVQAAMAYETPEGRELGDVFATIGSRMYDARRRFRAAQPETPPEPPTPPAPPEQKTMTAAEAEGHVREAV